VSNKSNTPQAGACGAERPYAGYLPGGNKSHVTRQLQRDHDTGTAYDTFGRENAHGDHISLIHGNEFDEITGGIILIDEDDISAVRRVVDCRAGSA